MKIVLKKCPLGLHDGFTVYDDEGKDISDGFGSVDGIEITSSPGDGTRAKLSFSVLDVEVEVPTEHLNAVVIHHVPKRGIVDISTFKDRFRRWTKLTEERKRMRRVLDGLMGRLRQC